MPELNVIVQRKHDMSVLVDTPEPLIDGTKNQYMTLCLIRGSKLSGPQVLIISFDATGTMCMQISLEKFLLGADRLIEMAKNEWNWEPPDTYLHLMKTDPDPKTARRIVLETIKKELERLDVMEGNEG